MKLHDYLADIRWIQYSPDLAKVFTPTGSILLCWLIWKSRDCGGPVEATKEKIADETGMSERNIETAVDRLKEGGVLTVTSKRLEHRTFYAIDADALEAAWGASRERTKRPVAPKAETDCPESAKRPFGTVLVRTEVQEQVRTADAPSKKLQKQETKPQETSPSPATASAAQEAYALWIGRYNEAHPEEPYHAGSAKRRKADLAAMRSLVDSGRTPEHIGEVARRMFAAAKLAVNGKRVWWSEHCKTAFNFGEHWNEITGELGPVAGSTSGTSTAMPASDDKFLKRWTREQGPVREQFHDDSSFRAHSQAWQQWAEGKV